MAVNGRRSYGGKSHCGSNSKKPGGHRRALLNVQIISCRLFGRKNVVNLTWRSLTPQWSFSKKVVFKLGPNPLIALKCINGHHGWPPPTSTALTSLPGHLKESQTEREKGKKNIFFFLKAQERCDICLPSTGPNSRLRRHPLITGDNSRQKNRDEWSSESFQGRSEYFGRAEALWGAKALCCWQKTGAGQLSGVPLGSVELSFLLQRVA